MAFECPLCKYRWEPKHEIGDPEVGGFYYSGIITLRRPPSNAGYETAVVVGCPSCKGMFIEEGE